MFIFILSVVKHKLSNMFSVFGRSIILAPWANVTFKLFLETKERFAGFDRETRNY